ncbi:MAG: dihydroorotate dehydrogenase electron transfer subunit [Phycisphaeraceae bacterium]|nr:dihydroorotate dehydrogenase electron transfer subunit [Phycisphaeraceae bacterium]
MPAPSANVRDDHPRSARGRARFDAVVERNHPLCRAHYLLRLRLPADFPATAPGQFIQLACRRPDGAQTSEVVLAHDLEWEPGKAIAFQQPELLGPLALLRRPFSLAGRGDDERGPWVEIVHRVVGVGTQWLSRLKVGDSVDLIGPLGNRFQLPKDRSLGLLVGGGVGLPPMFYLAQALQAAGWQAVAFVGAQARDLLPVNLDSSVPPATDGQPALSVQEFARYGLVTVITTDDGSLGLKGLITEGLTRFLKTLSPAQRQQAVVFTCGPNGMMRATASLAAAHGVDCQVCMEQAMACGMGTCQSCVVRVEDAANPQDRTADGRPWRYRLTCTDGPVFDARQIVWE